MRDDRDQSLVHVDIGICTFRRPELEETLLSLFALIVPAGTRVRLIVADNDATPSAEELVESLRRRSPFDIQYVHCPKSNISIARNACLHASHGDYLAFIDDDETADPQWLGELLATASATTADAVLGPVRALYGEGAPGWMKSGDFHSTLPVWVGGSIRTGYTCNVLLDMRSPRVRGRRFALALGQSGGEDTHFFSGVTDDGGLIAFAEKAMLVEPVPPKRAQLGWLMKRRFRSGQTHGRILAAKTSLAGRMVQAGLAGLKAAFCGGAAVVSFFSPVARNRYALRAMLHLGAISGLFGMREIRQYGSMEAA
ncbi:succinoglycan biosynthesis protein ExoM [Neorhizobium galegae]|uniref:glycosyltransferase family 2 protein n=1 Tax=Rhizobium/Agrobacterium group TaxID=227290 RepID=UPI001AEB4380|nr:glycosyltransferase family 2 protein [Neorhizobium galegae]MBP2549826.1 succinoglycan biosynthesis protein ExoM [Neorhizobium galegae]